MTQLILTIHPRKVGLFFGLIALYLALQSLVAEYLIENVLDAAANESVIMVIDLFSVNAEQTIPTWYSVLLLFMAACVLALIAYAARATQERDTIYWAVLAAIFLYLSMDEGAVIHEIAAEWFQANLTLTGFWTFGWQIVAAPLVILFGLVYVRFLLRLPSGTRNLFIVAGVVYVGGALIVEGISANQWDIGDGLSFEYLAIATVEECCEMLGVVIFIYALLAYAVERQFTYIFASPVSAAVQTSSSPLDSGVATLNTRPIRQRIHPALLVVSLFIVGMNLALIYWAVIQAPKSGQADENLVDLPQTLIDALAEDDVVVTRVSGRFGLDNTQALAMSATMLSLFDEVTIVTLALTDASLILASETLPYDRDQLTEILHTYGEVQFIIFETNAVEAISTAGRASTQEQ